MFPSSGAEQVKHRPDLSADENAVLFAARDIFRLKLASDEESQDVIFYDSINMQPLQWAWG